MSSAGQQGDMPPSSSSESSSTAPRRRGANKLKRVQEATQPLVVESNTYGQPCNDEECPLARFIGLLIRDPNLVSINVKDWRKVPNDRKEMLYDTICAKFSGLEGPKVKKWVIGKMGELFRDELALRKALLSTTMLSHIFQINEYRDGVVLLLTIISTIDDLNYPEKTDTYYIANALYIFSASSPLSFLAFNFLVVKPLLQEKTSRKVRVLQGGGRDE
ncbi:hypothetical protein HHK36_028144 [Tetracentron sinense]|uniref:Uncharacterized protein n=1 Tax=Tetracentron sinense TaxID=13715 RepID=A0A834YG21_TETSI|nr:hypothetical protein HHK36_028144 [Tetracentron sinense]